MSLVEEAGAAVQEVAQARTFETVFPPFDFGGRTAPGHVFENRPVPLCEFSIEAGVVRDDDHCVGHERGDGCRVDPLSRDHFGRDAGERGNLRGDGAGRFVERSEDVPEPRDPAVRQVVELDHSKFDDFVLLLVEASRLYIEDDTGFTDLAIGGHERRSRHQAPQNAVIAGIDQRFGHRC
jgi:hypothetical protein